MTLTTRIIPILHVKGPNLVKGIHFEGLRVLGTPEAFAQKYYEEGADELIFIDTVASLYGRSSLHEVVERTAASTFIPLTVGGGIRSVEDARQLLRSGADKICLNTAAVLRPELISELAEAFGSQCVVIYVEAKNRGASYEVLTENAREPSGKEVVDWCARAVGLGCGEILLASVDRDGTGTGFDLELIEAVATLSVPVIAAGGCGSVDDMRDALSVGADSIGASSIFHYMGAAGVMEGKDRVGASGGGVAGEVREDGNTEFLAGNRGAPPFSPVSIGEAKEQLKQAGVVVRDKVV